MFGVRGEDTVFEQLIAYWREQFIAIVVEVLSGDYVENLKLRHSSGQAWDFWQELKFRLQFRV